MENYNRHFSGASPDQFKKFFELQGWTIDKYCIKAEKGTHFMPLSVRYGSGRFYVGDFLARGFLTFGAALDAANELAETKAFGGWIAN